jgi:hypothetical protein
MILDGDMHFGDGTEAILKHFHLKESIPHATFGRWFREPRQARSYLKLLRKTVSYFPSCDLILYQAGADVHVHDPLRGVLTSDEMIELDRNSMSTPCANASASRHRPMQGALCRSADALWKSADANESTKSLVEPIVTPPRRARPHHRAFHDWLDLNRSRFAHPVELHKKKPGHWADYSFAGIHPGIAGSLTESGLCVWAKYQGDCWDLLFDTDPAAVMSAQVRSKYLRSIAPMPANILRHADEFAECTAIFGGLNSRKATASSIHRIT